MDPMDGWDYNGDAYYGPWYPGHERPGPVNPGVGVPARPRVNTPGPTPVPARPDRVNTAAAASAFPAIPGPTPVPARPHRVNAAAATGSESAPP